MITPRERAEKIRNAPKNTSLRFKKMTPEEREKHRRQAVEHDNDAGMSSTDEFVFQRRREVDGQ